MTVFELKEKLHTKFILTTIYAPAEGYENAYYELGINDYAFCHEDVLGYEVIDNNDYCTLNIIINKPIDYTDVTITTHFVNGDTYQLISLTQLQLKLHSLYEYWPAHIDYRTGKEWQINEQLTIEESSSGSGG